MFAKYSNSVSWAVFKTVEWKWVAQLNHWQEDIGNKLPAFGPCLAQSNNQEEISDESSEGPKRFDRVDYLCF